MEVRRRLGFYKGDGEYVFETTILIVMVIAGVEVK